MAGLLGLIVLIAVLSLLFNFNNKKDPSLTGILDKQAIKIMYGDYGIVSGDSAQSIDKKLK